VDNKFFTKNKEYLRTSRVAPKKGGPRQVPRSPPFKHATECYIFFSKCNGCLNWSRVWIISRMQLCLQQTLWTSRMITFAVPEERLRVRGYYPFSLFCSKLQNHSKFTIQVLINQGFRSLVLVSVKLSCENLRKLLSGRQFLLQLLFCFIIFTINNENNAQSNRWEARDLRWDLSIQRSGSTLRALGISQLRTLSRSVGFMIIETNSFETTFVWDRFIWDHVQSWPH